MKQESPLSFRIEPELHERLEQCADRLRLKKYQLALMALEAAVEAIEKNDYKLVVPIQFSVAHVPATAPAPAQFPPRQVVPHEMNEPSSAQKTADPVVPGIRVNVPAAKYPPAKPKPPRQK